MDEPNQSRTSASLLRAILDLRNDQAWQRFFEQYTPLIVWWCHKKGLNRDETEELKSRVWASLVQRMKKGFRYDPSKRFRNWLCRVVTSKIKDLRRTQARRPGDWALGDSQMQKFLETKADADDLNADELADELSARINRYHELAREAMACVQNRVDEKTWKSFYLTAVEDQSAPDVASRLGITLGTLYVYRGRVRKMLREEFARLQKSENSQP